jgi:hypothetical protein
MATLFAHLSPYQLLTPADLLAKTHDELTQCLHFSTSEKLDGDYMGVPYMLVGKAEVTLTMYDTAAIVGVTIAAMRAKQQTIRANAEVEAGRIEMQISKMLAITNEVAT